MSGRRTSRDETIRQILAEHVRQQERCEPAERITHISTVLRYPPPPPYPPGEPRPDLPLRLRAPLELLERARAVSLRLPGQSPRAASDYQSRLLTDAVMTAIAKQTELCDDFLYDLMPLIRHGAALSLWKLATAATSIGPERKILTEVEGIRSEIGGPPAPLSREQATARRRLQLVAEALEEDEAWHAPSRFIVAATIARDLLAGERAEANEDMLHDAGDTWRQMYLDFLHADDELRAHLLNHAEASDCAGRGGTAVWRAERRVEIQELEDWLVRRRESDDPQLRMNPPGWRLSIPSTWRAVAPRTSAIQALRQYGQFAADQRVMAFAYRDRQAFWPLIAEDGGFRPVTGFEPIARAAAHLPADKASYLIEAVLIDWHDTDETDPAGGTRLAIPAHEAFAMGLIDAAERTAAMASARAQTLRDMDAIIGRLGADRQHLRRKLKQAGSNARKFAQIAVEYGIPFSITRATWVWPGRMVADEVVAAAPAALIEALAKCARETASLRLEQAAHAAWQDAVARYGRRV